MIWLRLVIVAAAAVTLFGCATVPPTVSVPVPVRCKEPTPDRPSMPTDSIAVNSALDAKVRSALAEIELREGYEDRLRTALAACR